MSETDKALKEFFTNCKDIFGEGASITLVVTTKGRPVEIENIKIVSNDNCSRILQAATLWAENGKWVN